MQWNLLRPRVADPLLAGLEDDAWVYFVHSYAAPDLGSCIATCEYGGEVVAMVRRDRVWATQFHPEKSGISGLRLLANFVALVRDESRPRVA
jgi:glutamine amidotransferase